MYALRKEPRLLAATCVLIAGLLAVCFSANRRDEANAAGGWSLDSSALSPRSEIAVARVGRYVYTVGGFDSSSQTTAVAERYDLRRKRVQRLPSMPVALNHPAAATWRGDLYVVGGYKSATGLSQESAALYRFDADSRRWRELRSMKTPRGALTAQVIGDRLYAVGGARGGLALGTVEVYDLRRKTWKRAPAMPTAREHLGSAVVAGKLYVVAGRAVGKGNFRTLERYDPKTRRWTKLADLLRDRGGNAAATVNGRVVAVGGEEAAGTIGLTEYYDRKTNRWTRVADMRTARHGLGVVGYRGRVYALQGGAVPGYSVSPAVESIAIP